LMLFCAPSHYLFSINIKFSYIDKCKIKFKLKNLIF
jgi:hypothetical protein